MMGHGPHLKEFHLLLAVPFFFIILETKSSGLTYQILCLSGKGDSYLEIGRP